MRPLKPNHNQNKHRTLSVPHPTVVFHSDCMFLLHPGSQLIYFSHFMLTFPGTCMFAIAKH